jgi:hypothetical protein
VRYDKDSSCNLTPKLVTVVYETAGSKKVGFPARAQAQAAALILKGMVQGMILHGNYKAA